MKKNNSRSSQPVGAAIGSAQIPSRSRQGGWIKRVLLVGVVGLLGLYAAGAVAGYIWVRHVRKNDTITFPDVALLRWKEVRRSMAVQQFAKARVEWEAKNYQAAFLAYTFAVNNDPDNIAGRLAAASFLSTAGSTTMALNMLEGGLARAPDDRQLIERTFDLLIASGRDRRALELLHRRSAPVFSDPNGSLLRTYEMQADLNLGDAVAARKLLEKYPELEKNQPSLPVVARVFWETKERLKAIELISAHVRTRPDEYSAYAQLAEWQLAAQMTDDAVRTATQACVKFPGDLAPRVLLIEALAAQSHRGRAWMEAIGAYLKEFGDRPQSITQLAGLAGRKGWVDLSRSLYEFGSLRQPDLGMLAFFYSDALLHTARVKEAQQVLAQIEAQAGESSPAFMNQLRHRQVIAAAALGDSANVREFARRLAATLRNDPDGLEISRRHFQKSGIAEAVAELSTRSPASLVAARK